MNCPSAGFPGRAGTGSGPGAAVSVHCAANSCGCAIAQGAVWSYLVVVLPPTLELVTHVDEREEYLDVQALIPQPTVKRFDVAVFHRPPGRMKLSCTPY